MFSEVVAEAVPDQSQTDIDGSPTLRKPFHSQLVAPAQRRKEIWRSRCEYGHRFKV